MLSEKLLIFVFDKKSSEWTLKNIIRAFVGRWMRLWVSLPFTGISRLGSKQQEKEILVSVNCNSSFRLCCWQTLLFPKLPSLFLFNMETTKVAKQVAVDRREKVTLDEAIDKFIYHSGNFQGQQESQKVVEKFSCLLNLMLKVTTLKTLIELIKKAGIILIYTSLQSSRKGKPLKKGLSVLRLVTLYASIWRWRPLPIFSSKSESW